jgi:CRP/FNR family transcriptional regulator
MQIDSNILIAWGGVARKYKKNQIVFFEDDAAQFYFQIIEGQVKLINLHNDGNEYIQGIFHEGDGFGEPPLFIEETYPSTAIAQKDSVIMKLSKSSFFKMIEDDPKIQCDLLKVLAQRIYNKSVTARELIHNTPEAKILGFLQSVKRKNENSISPILITNTRQEIANLTGLRVETVIRTLKKMAIENRVQIINRKLYF